jgi:hypothetical protein
MLEVIEYSYKKKGLKFQTFFYESFLISCLEHRLALSQEHRLVYLEQEHLDLAQRSL